MGSSIAISDAQYLARIKERCEADFKFCARYFFKHRKGQRFIFNDHHDLMCDDLMRVWRGEVQNLIINIPPRYSKTELVVILFTVWCFIKNPRCEFIHLSYSANLTLENSSAIRDIIRSHEFRQLWPEYLLTPHKDAKGAWQLVQGGVFMATMTGGTVTGFGAGRLDEYDAETGAFTFSGCLLIDDPLKPDDARHDTMREGVNRRWPETIKSRRNSPRTPTICIMQRIHQKDFVADRLADRSETWHTLVCPALIDEGLPTERALWAAKHTVADLILLRDAANEEGEPNPVAREVFAAQYQQNPRPMGGGMFRDNWWRHNVEPAEDVARRCSAFIMTADTAYTEKTANDPSSIGMWGAEGTRRLNRLDELVGRWEFPALLLNVVRFTLAWPCYGKLLIEAKASGLSLVQTLRKGVKLDEPLSVAVKADAQGTTEQPFSVLAVDGERIEYAAGADWQVFAGDRVEYPAGSIIKVNAASWVPKAYKYPDDKVGRAKEMSWEVHGGRVWLQSTDKASAGYAPWVQPYIDEHSAFTANDTHAHDDRIDDSTMAVSWWTKHGGGRGG